MNLPVVIMAADVDKLSERSTIQQRSGPSSAPSGSRPQIDYDTIKRPGSLGGNQSKQTKVGWRANLSSQTRQTSILPVTTNATPMGVSSSKTIPDRLFTSSVSKIASAVPVRNISIATTSSVTDAASHTARIVKKQRHSLNKLIARKQNPSPHSTSSSNHSSIGSKSSCTFESYSVNTNLSRPPRPPTNESDRPRYRAEIYAINAYLKSLETEKFLSFQQEIANSRSIEGGERGVNDNLCDPVSCISWDSTMSSVMPSPPTLDPAKAKAKSASITSSAMRNSGKMRQRSGIGGV